MDRLKSFLDYDEARDIAQKHANAMRRDVGVEKAKEYGKTVYRIKYLPAAKYRNGWELRCEVVQPT